MRSVDLDRAKIPRFNFAERLLHWSIALPFLICYVSALVLVVYYNPQPSRPYREWVSLVHRLSGVGLVALPPLAVVVGGRLRTHWENVKQGWIWSWAEVKWLLLAPLAAVSKRVALPEEGKFNAGEKLNFMWVMASWPLYGLTGTLIWFGDDLVRWTGWSLNLGLVPWLGHFSLAVVSTPLIAGHIFMAVVNPASRTGLSGMITGYVDRRWAAHHYRRWFRENFGRRTPTPIPVVAPPAPTPSPEDTARIDIRQVSPPRPDETQRGWAADRSPSQRLRAVMRTGAHATIEHMRTGAHVAVRTGYALTPATVTLVVVLGLGLFVGGVVLGGWVSQSSLYLREEALLLVTPSERTMTVPGGTLLHGAEVRELGKFGRFSLVRDTAGRTGYLATGILSAKPQIAPIVAVVHDLGEIDGARDVPGDAGTPPDATPAVDGARAQGPLAEESVAPVVKPITRPPVPKAKPHRNSRRRSKR